MSATYWTKRNDVGTPIQDILEDSNGNAVNLNGSTGVFTVRDRFGTMIIDHGVITNWSGAAMDNTGEVQYTPLLADVSTAGTYFCEWEITFESGAVESWPNDGQSFLNIVPDLE